MACIHKFASYLYLERLDFEPTVLIIGTFNPAWEAFGNYAQWFYGLTNNNYFWEVLPKLYRCQTLRLSPHTDWQTFCRQHQIALTDLLYSIDDANGANPTHLQHLQHYHDDAIARYFHQFTMVDIPKLLQQHPSIVHIYLTRQAGSGFWRKQWQPIVDYAQQKGLHAQTLLTPSGGARFQIPKNTQMTLRDFIFQNWQHYWHTL